MNKSSQSFKTDDVSNIQQDPQAALLDLAVKNYRSLALVPSITDGRILSIKNCADSTVCSIGSTHSQRDLERNETRKFEKFYNAEVQWKTGEVRLTSIPYQAEKHDIVIQALSDDCKLKAVVRKITKKENDIFYLEIWSDYGLVRNFNLTAAKKHGDVYGEVTLSSLHWSGDGTKLLYIAEKKKLNCVDKQCDAKPGDQQFDLNNEDQYLYEDDWGEQKTSIRHPVIVVLDVLSGDIEIVHQIPDFLSPGQCIWGPNQSIIFVGWWHVPFRLGMVYCENRRSAIFEIQLNGNNKELCNQLSNDGCSVHSPRISPDESILIFLERNVGGPHRGCERLMMYDFKARKSSIIYDIVDNVSDTNIGLYCHSLPQRCWMENGRFAVMHCNFKSEKIIVLVEIEKGILTRITHEAGCWSILDAENEVLLASFAAPNQPACLKIGRLNESLEVLWLKLEIGPSPHASLAYDIKWEKFPVSVYDGEENNIMENLLILPQVQTFGEKPPLIVWPHGGPHTVMSADFGLYLAAFSSLGFAVLQVNYRGSTGFGEKPLRSLLGRIGSQDVADVQKCAESALGTGRFNEEKVFIFGGSHGGFLSSHLIGQYPNFYKACILRNPVINLAGMTDVTDIPDWCYTEVGVLYNHKTLPTSENYAKMLESSPIFHVKKIVAPVMIMIGGNDVRVPPSQGRSFYRALKSMEKEVKMLWYPEDCHPINKVESEASAFISIIKWLHSRM